MAAVPTAWIIAIGLIFIPPLYAWFNTVGFWDPYGNTAKIPVAVVNQDKGTSNELLGDVNLGDEITTELLSNDQLGWYKAKRSEAMHAVREGSTHAAIVIPSDFSRKVAELADGSTTRPSLEYFVNEKANGVATKVTDTGATVVDRQVNDTFVSTVSTVVSDALNSAVDSFDSSARSAAQRLSDSLSEADQGLADLSTTLEQAREQAESTPQQTEKVRKKIATASSALREASSAASTASDLISQIQQQGTQYSASLSDSLDSASSALAQISRDTNGKITEVTSALEQGQAVVSQAMASVQNSVNELNNVLETLKKINPSSPLLSQLEAQLAELNRTLDQLSSLHTDAEGIVKNSAAASQDFDTATQSALATLQHARQSTSEVTGPQLSQALTQLAGDLGGISASISAAQPLTTHLRGILDQLDTLSASLAGALADSTAGIASMRDELARAQTDVTALASSSALRDFLGESAHLDTHNIADFMLSPTVVETKALYPVVTYGSGMAPLLMNLSLWVGVFALVVIMKLEVDSEDLEEEPSPTVSYLARFALLAILALFQGLATTIGEIVIGVQIANAPAFVFTGVVSSLVYLSIVYALSTTFLHVGKGLCVAMIILQIPGASGMYPIEMMPGFFRALYPFFPFTYSINAFREAIGGFYDGHWLKNIAVLLVFAVVAFAIGVGLRPRLVNLNRLFSRQLFESDMVNVEQIQLRAPKMRLQQLIAVLADRDEYREEVHARAERFQRMYPRYRRGALIAGIVVPAALVITFSLTTGSKVVALAAWMAWLVIIIGFLMVIEMARDSIERQLSLGELGDEAVVSILARRHHSRHGHHGRHARKDHSHGEGADASDVSPSAAHGEGVAEADVSPGTDVSAGADVSGAGGAPEEGRALAAPDFGVGTDGHFGVDGVPGEVHGAENRPAAHAAPEEATSEPAEQHEEENER